MQYVGLDIHWKTLSVCILNESGQVVKRKTIRSGWKTLLGFCREIEEPFAVCFEASCGYGYLYDALSAIARRVVVGHPGHLRLISRSKRKNDRIDAEKLAKLLYLDMVPAAHVPSFEIRQWRGMIEYRQRVVAKRVRCKNALRALLRSQGIQMPRGLWTRKGLAWLESVELRGELSALRREMLLEELATLQRQVKRLTKALNAIGRKDPGVMVLRTIPGVGPRTAETIVAYVDDPQRFGRVRQAGAYFGLVPCQDASAGTNRLGHITRQGPATARKLLVEAAWQVIRRCPRTRQRFERIAGTNRDRRKIAVVAVAHHLARCMVRMLQTGEAWRPAA